MIIGHTGVAFVAKSRRQGVPLLWVLVATYAPDLWRTVLMVATGMHYTRANLYSHAIPWCVLLAGIVAGVAWISWKDRTITLMSGAVVLSHIALDMISGNKPLWDGGPVGLDLEEFQQLEIIIEGALLWLGWHLLRRSGTRSWTQHRAVPTLLVLFQAIFLIGTISRRPYATRCLASPIGTCSETTWITKKWETRPLW